MSAPPYPFVPTDGGRSASRRPRQRDDCTVRALAVAAELSYDDAYDLLKAAGRGSSRRFRFDEWVLAGGTVAGRRLERRTFPAVRGERRMNPETFCALHREGRWIVRTAKHVFAVVDGALHDDRAVRPDRCVYAAYRLTAG